MHSMFETWNVSGKNNITTLKVVDTLGEEKLGNYQKVYFLSFLR
jgi:hypothetical protein